MHCEEGLEVHLLFGFSEVDWEIRDTPTLVSLQMLKSYG